MWRMLCFDSCCRVWEIEDFRADSEWLSWCAFHQDIRNSTTARGQGLYLRKKQLVCCVFLDYFGNVLRIDLDCALSFQDAQSAQQIYSELCDDPRGTWIADLMIFDVAHQILDYWFDFQVYILRPITSRRLPFRTDSLHDSRRCDKNNNKTPGT